MAIKSIRIGSIENAQNYDDALFDSAIETTEPIKAGTPIDPTDVIRLADLGDYVKGPGSATDNAIARFDGAGGKTIQDSLVTIDDSGNVVIPADAGLTVDTNTLYVDKSNHRLGVKTTSPIVDFNVYKSSGGLVAAITTNNTSSGSYIGIGIGYAESGPNYMKSAIVQEQIGDGAARGTIHILNNGGNNALNASLSDARVSINYNGIVGIDATSPTISSSGKLHMHGDIVRLEHSHTPANAGDTGNGGEICWDSDFIYVCIAANTWKKAAITTW